MHTTSNIDSLHANARETGLFVSLMQPNQTFITALQPLPSLLTSSPSLHLQLHFFHLISNLYPKLHFHFKPHPQNSFFVFPSNVFLTSLQSQPPLSDEAFKIPSTTSSFCQSEQMHLDCPSSSLLLISQARYGRMTLSKCVKQQFGAYLGCWSDATGILDARCSGKKECSVKILEENFKHMRPCHDDLKSYLEVTYACVTGGVVWCCTDVLVFLLY